MRSISRSPIEMGVGLGVAAIQLACAYLVLGVPDLGAARAFLLGTMPTMAGSVATAQLVLWLVLGLAILGLLAGVVSGAVTTIAATRRSGAWSLTVVAIGIVILVVGLNHHGSAGSVSFGGGSVQEAQAQIAR